MDNGYGKPSGVENMAEAYDRHETGPNCHNTLIFRDQEGNVLIPPPFAAVIARRRFGDCCWSPTGCGERVRVQSAASNASSTHPEKQ